MSQENVRLVRALFDAVEEGGLDAARDFVHPDFEMLQLPLHPEAGTYRGGRAAAGSIESWIESFDDFKWEAEDFIDAGDHVVVIVRETGKARGGGIPLDHRYGAVCTVREGKVARLEWFHDRAQALKVVGVKLRRA